MNTRLIGNRLIIARCPNGLKSQGEEGLKIKTVKTFPSKYAKVFKKNLFIEAEGSISNFTLVV